MDLRVPFILVLAALPGLVMASARLLPQWAYLPTSIALGAVALVTTAACIFFAWRTQVLPRFDPKE